MVIRQPATRLWAETLTSIRAHARPAGRSSCTTAIHSSNLSSLSADAVARPVARRARPAWTSVPTRPQQRTIFIQTEDTPNTDALKFKPNQRVLPDNFGSPFLEYLSPRSTLAPPHPSPLAAQLLSVDGVTAVFYGADFITITKDSSAVWAHVKPQVFALITEAVTSGQALVTSPSAGSQAASENQQEEHDSLAYDDNDSEVVGMIKELLETRIRPAIQEDGGDIDFRGFVDGQVLLKLRGACRTCDSSTVTLKNGIESMLCHYIEEVQGVQQVLDPEEEVAMREFARFEEKLKQQKGAGIAAAT